MMHLKQSTASQSVVIGPFVDSTDGDTAETGLTIANTDIRLSKNGANIAAKNSGGGTHDELGYYTITLDATDTNTVGRLQLMVHESGALPVYHEYEVLEEAVYDNLYGSAAVGPLAANSNGSGLTEAGGTGDQLTAINLPNQTMDITGNITGNLSGSVGSVTGNVGGVAGTIQTLDALDTAQDTQHAATQTDIAALNDLATSDLDTALATYDGPTNAEMEARTIAAADYLVEGDTLARVTLVDTTTTNTDMRGTDSAATEAKQDIIDGNVDTMVSGIIEGAAATGTLSTTQASTNLSGYTDDQLIGRHITVLSGVAEGEQSDITDYADTNGVLTFTAMTLAMANGDTFKIT